MKRFLSIILTAAMLMSATPAVFAENNAVDESVIVAEELTPENQEEITEEVAENVTEDVSEEISGEGEENSEEQISLMSEENDVSLLANETNEVQYSTDNGSTWTGSTFDNIWSEAEKTANKGKSYQIKVSKDFSLTENKKYSLSYGVKVTIYADTDVTITVPTSTKIIVKSGGQYNGGDATLTFGKSGAAGTVTFDGKNETFSEAAFLTEWNSGSYMGHLVINDGVSIKNFKRSQGGTYYGIIYNNGQLDINGGLITNNEISSNTVDSVIFNCRKLNIAGGEISNNSITSYDGYIVMVRGSSAEFTMTGGKIVSNNVRKTVIQLAQDDSSYQGSATITEGTIANNKGYSYSDDNFTADARDISIGASLTKLTLNGTAEIGTIETNVKNINNSKFITIASGFAPATPISVLVAMSYIGGQVYPSEGMQVASVENGASINGMLVYYNTDFSISDDAPPEVEYSIRNQTTNFEWKSFTSTLKDALTKIDESSNAGKIKLLKDIEIKDTIGTSSNNIYSTVTLSDIDGNGFTIKRASGFTGEMIKLGAYKCTVHDVTLDGQNVENCSFLINAPAVGNSKGTHLVLEKVTLCNNKNSAIKGEVKVEGTNVTVQNCSAKFGGAIYFESGATSAATVNFTNSVFSNNSADTGSVAYLKSAAGNVFTAKFDGCKFENNGFVADESNTDSYTKSSLIYAYSDSSETSYNSVTLAGTTSFSENNVNSDVLLDGNLSNKTSSNTIVPAGLNIGDAFSAEKPIKVAVGSYARDTYTDGGLIVYLADSDSGNFNLVDVNGSTKVADGGNIFMLKQISTSKYLVIGSPRKIYTNFNYNRISCNSIADFNNKVKDVTLSATPALTSFENDYGKKMDQAVENINYVIGAQADNVKITKYYAKYSAGLGYKTIDGEVEASGSSAKLNLTPEVLSAVADAAGYSLPTLDFYIEYEVLAQPITIASVTGGTISTNPAGSANVGSTVQLNYTADDGYEFADWNVYKTGELSTKVSVSDNSFTMPTYGVTVSATFVKKKYAVTITKDGEGTVAISPELPVEVGQTVTVTATPDEHWELSSLTMNGTDITSAKSFVMPNEAVELKAVFTKKKFTVTADTATNGKISLLTDSPLNWGESFTINVQANPHYEIDTVIVDGKAVSVNEQGDYTFEMPTHDVIVSATFKKVKYTITGTGDHATFSIPSSDTYNWGDTVEITVTPDKWYNIKSVYANDATVAITPVAGKENTYSFTMPQGNITITAIAERPNFNVEFVSNGGSSVDGQVIANGNTVTKPSTPTYVNHGFAGWYTSPTFEADTKYDFSTNVTGNVKLYARWFLWGDVNGDGDANAMDALLVNRCRIGAISYDDLKYPIAARVNDVTNDRPNAMDALLINRHRIGAIAVYPVETQTVGYEFDIETNTYITNK